MPEDSKRIDEHLDEISAGTGVQSDPLEEPPTSDDPRSIGDGPITPADSAAQ